VAGRGQLVSLLIEDLMGQPLIGRSLGSKSGDGIGNGNSRRSPRLAAQDPATGVDSRRQWGATILAGLVLPDKLDIVGAVIGWGGGMRAGSMAVWAGLATVMLSLPTAADAEGLTVSTTSRARDALFRSQTRLLDTRLAVQYEDSARLRPDATAADALPDGAVPDYAGRYRGQFLDVAKSAAARHAVPEDLFLRLVQQESGWNPQARSLKGATGLAQLMPGTAQGLGVDPADPSQNLEGGARYLRQMFDRFGSWRLALAAYNAGPEAVAKYGGIPPYQETRNYVLVIYGS